MISKRASVRRLRAELAIAWRYLRSAREDALIHQLSRITVAGLALGVGALILALSVLTGFQEHLLADVLERSPLIQVEWAQRRPPDLLMEQVAAVDGVESLQRLRQGQGWLRVEATPRPVQIIAYERSVPSWLMPVVARSPAGQWNKAAEAEGGRVLAEFSGLYLPLALATSEGVELHDVVELVTPRQTQTPMGKLIPSRRFLPVQGLLSGSRIEEVIRDRVGLPLSAGDGLLGAGGSFIDISLAEQADETQVLAAIEDLLARGEWSGAKLVSWRQRHAALLFVLKLEKAAVFSSVALIVLVASFALVSALALILSAKRHELGLLSAVGMSRRRIRRLFLMLGAMLACSGAATGGLLGVSAAWVLDHFELIPLPGDLYVVDHVPFAVRGPELSAVLLATLLVTIVAAAFGARGATSWTPVEALRR